MTYTNTEHVSALNCPDNSALRTTSRFAPLGASVWTGSGELAKKGITAIAQAAPGAMKQGAGFDPTNASFAAAIENSFALAAIHGRTRLAIPFIGGGIFFHRITPPIDKDKLARIIVDACISHHGGVDAVIVAYPHSVYTIFQSEMAGKSDPNVHLVEGSITDFSVHSCDAIANAANMEVTFGGGLSGQIATKVDAGWIPSAPGEVPPSAQINADAQTYLAKFWKLNPGTSTPS